MLTVHLRVTDSATGRPTPARLSVAGPDGTAYAPFGRSADFPVGRNEDVGGGNLYLDGRKWHATDGSCELRLPAGVPLAVELTKGPLYRPVRETVTLGTGQIALRFTLTPADDVPAGWAAGDARAHFLPPHSAALEGAAEGLAVVNLLAAKCQVASQNGTLFTAAPNLLAFSGQQPAVEAHGCRVVVNTFNAHPALGKLSLLNCHRAVYPLSFGGPEATDDWTLADWCDQCHRKGGLVVWSDFAERARDGGEALADLVLGRIDAVELNPRRLPLAGLSALWDAGFPVPLVGASGKDSNRTPLGAVRTYARVDGDDWGYRDWVEACRAGRTVASTGPFLSLTAGDAGPGGVIDGDAPVRLAAAGAFERVELVADGAVVASGAGRAECEWRPTKPGWAAARGVGPASAFAHTSPVRVRVGGRFGGDRHAAAKLAGLLDQTRLWVERVGRFAESRNRDALLATLDEAGRALAGRGEP